MYFDNQSKLVLHLQNPLIWDLHMDKKRVLKIFLMVLPFAVFLVGATYLPVHNSIQILMIPFIPILLILDIAFFLAPLFIFVLIFWCIKFLISIFRKQVKIFVKKTKYIPLIAILIMFLGFYASTHTTTFFLDVDIPTLGLMSEE